MWDRKGTYVELRPDAKRFMYVIPTISECIIITIFPIMTWLDLDSLGHNNQPSDWAFFTNRLPIFLDQSIATFWPSDCPKDQAIATFQASNFQSQVYSSDCHFIPIDCLVSWPTSPSDCLAFPSDCLLCAVTKRLLLLGKRLLTGRSLFSSFHKESISVLSLSYKYEPSSCSLSLSFQNIEISLSLSHFSL